jgi:hypothetical protein
VTIGGWVLVTVTVTVVMTTVTMTTNSQHFPAAFFHLYIYIYIYISSPLANLSFFVLFLSFYFFRFLSFAFLSSCLKSQFQRWQLHPPSHRLNFAHLDFGESGGRPRARFSAQTGDGDGVSHSVQVVVVGEWLFLLAVGE